MNPILKINPERMKMVLALCTFSDNGLYLILTHFNQIVSGKRTDFIVQEFIGR